MSRLAARVLTGTTLAVLAAGLLWLARQFPAGYVALVVVTGLAGVCVWELDHLGSFRGRGLAHALYPALLVSSLLVGVDLLREMRIPAVQELLWLYLCALVSSWRWMPIGTSLRVENGRERLPAARETVPLSLWLLPPLFSLVLVDRDFGGGGLVALVVLAKIGDNAGYFVGRKLGKTHPFPRISPGKTTAGCVASFVAGTVAGALILPLTLGARSWSQALLGAGIGAAINLAAQAGDLSESWVKRRAGVKDSSALVGASGGVLDVIDSLLLASPVALLLWTWLYPVREPIS